MNSQRPFTEEQLHLFREKLEEERSRISDRLSQIEEKEIPDLDMLERGDSYGDDAKQDQIRSRLLARAEKLRKDLTEVEAALLRLENKTYGIDKNTGDPIPVERLLANPTATEAIH